jgi:hypothetical protein
VAYDKRDGQLVSLVYLVFLVCLVEPDRPDEPDQPSLVAPFSSVSRECGIGIFGAICGFSSNMILLLLLKYWFRPIISVDYAHDLSASFHL